MLSSVLDTFTSFTACSTNLSDSFLHSDAPHTSLHTLTLHPIPLKSYSYTLPFTYIEINDRMIPTSGEFKGFEIRLIATITTVQKDTLAQSSYSTFAEAQHNMKQRTSYKEAVSMLEGVGKKDTIVIVLAELRKYVEVGGLGGTWNWEIGEECCKAVETLREFEGINWGVVKLTLLNEKPPLFLKSMSDMLANAKGLCFIKSTKLAVGVGIQAGTGIVIARNGDGWSAPSSFGMVGGVLGGVGAASSSILFIISSEEGLQQFMEGEVVVGGGGVGAVAGRGKEGFIGASAANCGSITFDDQGSCGADAFTEPFLKSHKKTDSRGTIERPNSVFSSMTQSMTEIPAAGGGVTALTAFAISAGAYVGISVEGCRLFCRDSVNQSLYKMRTGREVTPRDLLSGRVDNPSCAKNLYTALHSFESYSTVTYPEIPDTIGQAVIAENPTIFGKTEKENEVPASIASAWRAVNAAKKKSADIKDFEKLTLKALHKGIAVTAVLEESSRKPAILKMGEDGYLKIGFQFSQSQSQSQPSPTIQSSFTLSSSIDLHSVDAVAFEPFIDFPINFGESSEKFRLCNLQNIDDNTLAFFCDSVKENVFLLAGIRMLSVTEARRLGRKSTTLYPTLSDYSLTEGDPGAPTLSRCIGCLTAKFNFEALRIFLIDPDSPVMEDFRHVAAHYDGQATNWKPDGGDWDCSTECDGTVASDDDKTLGSSVGSVHTHSHSQGKLFLMNMTGYKRSFRFRREGRDENSEKPSEIVIEAQKIEMDSDSSFTLSRSYQHSAAGFSHRARITMTLTQPSPHHIALESFSKVIGPRGGNMETDSVIYQVQQEVEGAWGEGGLLCYINETLMDGRGEIMKGETSTFASLSRSPERPEEKRNSKSPVEQKAADNELVNKDSSSSLSTQSSSMQVQNNQPTVMVMPLPKLPLTLLPCPVEDDEDNLTQDTEDRKQMSRDDERRRKRGMLRTGFAVDEVRRNLIESRDDIDVDIIEEEGGGKNDKKVKGILTKIGLK
ncbi:hypothetical protein TrLO_g3669 [Triparma laevis f. longispina]|uniref:Ysc84 actin-binding domain-containing protein n=1 Tax=Triparma laevis f. longispina TaxID=1714387 RepID=A0A9W7KZC6_9STRA|nr:hypothetical protein TrLO_g3669 [Triparma laevis f. longispina]